jgi:hypothetical protein
MHEVRGLVARNDRRQDWGQRRDSDGFIHQGRGEPVGEWGVRFGSVQHPDYAHPTYGGGYTGGRILSPDDAEALAAALIECAAWARAQNVLTPADDEAP